MNISSKDYLAGYPILKIRELLKKGNGLWYLALVEEILSINKKQALSVVKSLIELGFIEINKNLSSEKDILYKNTIKGNALANASAAKPIIRKTAEKKLEEFLKRVVFIKDSDYFLYKASKVILFGSYLSDKERISDIDLIVELVSKEKNEEKLQKLLEARIDHATKRGALGNKSFFEKICFPQIEVFKFLKSRQRSISIHGTDQLQLLEKVDSKIIYQDQ